jgi:hypothetical protein
MGWDYHNLWAGNPILNQTVSMGDLQDPKMEVR